MKKRIEKLANKKVCEITFDDIVDLQVAAKEFIELEKSLRKNATREKAKNSKLKMQNTKSETKS